MTNFPKARQIVEPLIMIALSVFLFVAALNIETTLMLDRIIVPFIYLCAAVCFGVGVYMCSPSGRKMSVKIGEIEKREKDMVDAELNENPGIMRYALRKAVSRELPVLVVLIVFFAVGRLTSCTHCWRHGVSF